MTRDKTVWADLWLHETAQDYACEKWLDGFNLTVDMPLPEDISIPHWQIWPVIGKAPEDIFFYRLSRGIFSINQRLRSREEMDYLEERDYFHDVFGHTPILHDKEFSDFVRTLGLMAQYIKSPEGLRAVSNVYWFIVEFGLVIEYGELRIMGAGILSSTKETRYSIREGKHIHLDYMETVHDLFDQKTYVVDGMQDHYYVLQNWSDLGWILKLLFNKYA